MVEDRSHRILLQRIDQILSTNPSREALLDLLQFGDPKIVDASLKDEAKRKKALKLLKLLIHPDKCGGDNFATKRFQDVDNFFSKCLKRLHVKKQPASGFGSSPFGSSGFGGASTGFGFGTSKNRHRSKSRTRSTLPANWHINDKWPLLDFAAPNEPVAPTFGNLDTPIIEKTMAYKCINYRGTIVHGKGTELEFNFVDNVNSIHARSAQDVFHDYGGHKTLCSIEEIKQEIMQGGPVVSTSFHLTQEFLWNAQNQGNKPCFEPSQAGKEHAVMIVGWKTTSLGQMWLVQTPRSQKGRQGDVGIFTGQFSIEDEVLAPASDLSNKPWQEDDSVLDVPRLPKDWYTYTPAIVVHCTSTRLESLFKSLGCSWSQAVGQRKPFVIREADRIARSRYAHLQEIEWAEDKSQWKITAVFEDQPQAFWA